MKKLLLCLLMFIVTPITGCTIDYSNFQRNDIELPLVQNQDGTYTKNFLDSTCSNVDVYYIDLKDNNNETKIGDSTYIKCGNVDIVIDAGIKNVGSNSVVPFLKEKVTDKIIELVIVTHTDNDHIGGFVGLSSKEGVLSITDFTYEYIIESGFVADSQVYRDLMELIDDSGAKVCTGYQSITGENECAKTFKLGNATLDVLDTGLYNDNKASANDRSVVTLLTHNEVTFLFPGDLEEDEEFAETLGHIDIVKAAHHGASSANSSAILNAMTPEVIIISAGLDGVTKYDIPQQVSLDRMYAVTDTIYATFTTGTIKISSDGNTYTVSADNLVLFQNTNWFAQNRVHNAS